MSHSPRVLYVCSEDWYFRNHRLDHAKALMRAGFEVHVATRPDEASHDIAAAGCIVHAIEVNRGIDMSVGLLRDSWTVARIIRRSRPDVVHCVSLKTIALTLPWVPWFRRTAFILAVNGLGVSALHSSRAVKVLGSGISMLSRLKRVTPLFQNHEDPVSLGVPADQIKVIPGVGVDLEKFPYTPLPDGPPWRVVYLGRAVRSKGLMDIAEVANRPAIRAAQIEFHLYCAIDSTSPGSLSQAELGVLRATPGVTVHPATATPFEALAASHLALLPSHGGEGVSKFILEALAVGRPVVVTQTAGASMVVADRVNGRSYKPSHLDGLAGALIAIFELGRNGLEAAGELSHDLAVRQFSLSTVVPEIIQLHHRMVFSERS